MCTSAFQPSTYQQAIFSFITNGAGNAVINAVAGSGKTTTIVKSIDLIPTDKQVAFIAFNKSIVAELQSRIGNRPNVQIMTLHSLGYKACKTMVEGKLNINSDKYLSYLNCGIESGSLYPVSPLDDDDKLTWKVNIRQLIDLGRSNLKIDQTGLNELADKFGLVLIDNEAEIAENVIKWGTNCISEFDFTDMIYMPNAHNVKFPKFVKFDIILIDECQDLNAAQRELFLRALKRNGRFIAVGDPKQAIYGFSGADVESFELLKKIRNTIELPLSVNYRCGTNIIDIAKEFVPQLEACDTAIPGIVDQDAKMEMVKAGDMIICRTTAPLVSCCMKYIANGIKANVKGKDIGTNLINMITKTKKIYITEALKRMEYELEKIVKKQMDHKHCSEEEARNTDQYIAFADKISAIEIISEGFSKSNDVCKRIEEIFADEIDGICLSTVHKAKGLESDNVYIICPEKFCLKHCMRIPWMAEQEHNLQYVAYTRAKKYLGFITDFKM